MRKGSYKVDLVAYHQACEVNYQRMIKLLPRSESDLHIFSIPLANHQTTQVHVEITERCKYTTMLTISLLQGVKWLDCRFELRLYHDVKMMDVVSFQGHRHIWPVQRYPNTHMYHPDEKHQHQQFLSHLLTYCQENGLSDFR